MPALEKVEIKNTKKQTKKKVILRGNQQTKKNKPKLL
jgi:hypothetical protein